MVTQKSLFKMNIKPRQMVQYIQTFVECVSPYIGEERNQCLVCAEETRNCVEAR